MTIRSFLAFELSKEVRETLRTVIEEGRKAGLPVRWVPVGNIHLTVVFMGNVAESRIRPISDAAGEICGRHAPFQIQARGIGLFGSPRRPRVLWIGLAGDVDRMAVFRDDLQGALAPFGIRGEERAFRPHLTLGRFRDGARGDASLNDLLARYEDLTGPACLLRELTLFRSDLKPGGSVYTQMAAWPLRGQPNLTTEP